MRIGVLGGSFNPPHKMHEKIASTLIEKNLVDKVIFVPTGSKYKYKNNLVSDLHRFNMLKIITDKNPFFEVSNFELKDHVIYTYETLNHFKELYPESEIYFICGADNLSYIDTWMNSEYILTNYQIIATKRDNYNIDEILKKLESYQNNINIVNMDLDKTSSTYIRENINDEKVKDFLDKDVYNYIIKNNLY